MRQELAGEFRTAGGPGLLRRWRTKICKPAADDPLQQFTVESVVAGASFAADLNHTRAVQDVQVTRGGRPAVGEAASEIAGGEFGAAIAEKQYELAARGVSEGAEDGVDLSEVGRTRGLHSISCYAKC